MRFAPLLFAALPAIALAQTATAPVTKPVAKTSADDKVICKTSTEIGSLIAQHKECKTRREWDIQSSESQKRIGDCISGAGATGARC